jgi:hypothetical protein
MITQTAVIAQETNQTPAIDIGEQGTEQGGCQRRLRTQDLQE